MKTVEIRVDPVKGRLKAKGTLYAGSKVGVSFSPEAGDAARLGLFVFDRRQHEDPRIEPRISVFPPPGLKCIAVTEREGDALVLDLNVQELLDLFADGKRKPGSKVSAYLYLWDAEAPEVVAMGVTAVEWSPVYFTPTRTPVSMKGEKGAKGDPGEKGDKGEKGERGEKGDKGERGEKGEAGEAGPVGARGAKGETGARGPRGERGETGERGERGPKGERGEKGEKGERGEKGDAGEPGPVGAQGAKGETGERGPAGVRGPQGETGERGPQGERGERGEQGRRGEKGDAGDPGPTGARGPKGDRGERGEKGDRGEKGETGARGQAGERGEKGETGAQGVCGPQGAQGPQGERGERGQQGPRGPAAAETKYVRCDETGKFHRVTVRHNAYGEPVLDVDTREEETLPEGLPCGIEGLFGLEVGEDGHLYVTVAEGHGDLSFGIEEGHLKLQIGG